MNDRQIPGSQRLVVQWARLLPFLAGTALTGIAVFGSLQAIGALELGLAVLLGLVIGEAPFRTGALLILPLAAPVIVLAAFNSMGTFAFAIIAAAVLTAINGLLAAAGVMIRQAITTG